MGKKNITTFMQSAAITRITVGGLCATIAIQAAGGLNRTPIATQLTYSAHTKTHTPERTLTSATQYNLNTQQ